MIDFRLIGNRNASERLTSIPIVKSPPYILKTLYSERVASPVPGDLYLATVDFQVTTSYAYVVMLASTLRVCATPDPSTFIEEIAEAQGQNFNMEEHHFNGTRVGWWAPQASYPEVYFNFIVYAASAHASPGHTLRVDQDYGRLSILHLSRPPIVPPAVA